MRTSRILLAPLILALAAPAEAGLFRRCHKARRVSCARTCPTYAGTSTPYVGSSPGYAGTSQATPQDSGGFVAWLNGVRASRGLGAVGWDAGLAGLAASNSARGYGHWAGTNPGRQNVGMGSLDAVSSAWLASAPHASALLDPNIRAVGLANVNGVWTYSAF
jgi:uncharacterized protein YkwD